MIGNAMTLSNRLTPSLFRQMVIGFDDFFNDIHNVDKTYPPYNIKRTSTGFKTGEDIYTLEMAIAGFKKSDIKVNVENNILKVTGEQKKNEIDYIHKGMATRNFTRSFSLARHIEVEQAKMEDGLLKIRIIRNLPKELRPKEIKIV